MSFRLPAIWGGGRAPRAPTSESTPCTFRVCLLVTMTSLFVTALSVALRPRRPRSRSVRPMCYFLSDPCVTFSLGRAARRPEGATE